MSWRSLARSSRRRRATKSPTGPDGTIRLTGGAATSAQEGEGLQRLAGEYFTTQHKRVVFEIRMKKWKENRTMGPSNMKSWKCKGRRW